MAGVIVPWSMNYRYLEEIFEMENNWMDIYKNWVWRMCLYIRKKYMNELNGYKKYFIWGSFSTPSQSSLDRIRDIGVSQHPITT